MGLCSGGAKEVQQIRECHWLYVSKDHSDPYWTGQLSKPQVAGSLAAESTECLSSPSRVRIRQSADHFIALMLITVCFFFIKEEKFPVLLRCRLDIRKETISWSSDEVKINA